MVKNVKKNLHVLHIFYKKHSLSNKNMHLFVVHKHALNHMHHKPSANHESDPTSLLSEMF